MNKWLIYLFLFSVIFACSDDQDNTTESTRAMARELNSIANQARTNGAYPYFTDALIKKLEAGLVGLPFTMRQGQWLDYMLMLILKGENEKCIALIDQYFSATGTREVSENTIAFHKIQALAYLRLGEITNCVQNHSAQSCIMPIKGGGIHLDKQPVEAAIVIYNKLLDYSPEDLQSRWFLNLCYMAIGSYPDHVPSEYLIPASSFESAVDFPVFKNLSLSTGVATNNHAGGASIADFNNDGLQDIFTTSYSLAQRSRLYINNGQGGFTDQTDQRGLMGMVGGLNNIHADFNNDGLTDIFIMRGAWLGNNGQIPNSLLLNKGEYFSDETKSSGLYFKSPTGTIAAADVNLDGHLDLFVGNESRRGSTYPCQLFINNGDGSFDEASESYGLALKVFAKGAVWGDINNDGWPDLYLSVYDGPNKLYVNRKGVGDLRIFEEIANSAGVAEPRMSFTSWFWDYDQDGWEDIMVFGYDNSQPHLIANQIASEYLRQGFSAETPRLYKNNRDETFTNVTTQVGLDKLLYVMGGNFGDFNNDGFPDMYLGTGEFNIWATVPNKAFLNKNGKSFIDVTSAGEFGQIQKGHGVAFGDLDNDGDQDIYHQVGGAAESDVFQNMLFQNPGFGNHWITIKLEGKQANRSAIGARVDVTVVVGDTVRTIYHTIGTGGSFGANSLRAEIGLGKADSIRDIKIRWPDISHSVQHFPGVEMDKAYLVTQGGNLVQWSLPGAIHLNNQVYNHAHH